MPLVKANKMANLRITYFILIITVIVVGLLSRHFTAVPLFIGDILWALMIYFIARFLLMSKPVSTAFIVSLLFCYAIEFSQLYQAPWLNSIRHTLLGRLILGQGFLWSDLLCYTVGTALGYLADKMIVKLS